MSRRSNPSDILDVIADSIEQPQTTKVVFELELVISEQRLLFEFPKRMGL